MATIGKPVMRGYRLVIRSRLSRSFLVVMPMTWCGSAREKIWSSVQQRPQTIVPEQRPPPKKGHRNSRPRWICFLVAGEPTAQAASQYHGKRGHKLSAFVQGLNHCTARRAWEQFLAQGANSTFDPRRSSLSTISIPVAGPRDMADEKKRRSCLGFREPMPK